MTTKTALRLVFGLVGSVVIVAGVLLILARAGIPLVDAGILGDNPGFAWAGALLILLGLVVIAWAVWGGKAALRIQNDWLPGLSVLLSEWTKRDETISEGRRGLNLVLISAAGLFFELVLIRYLGAEIKVFAFLKNVILIAAFLGLGLGFFLARRGTGLLPLFLPATGLLMATVALGATSGLLTLTLIPQAEELVLVGLTSTPGQTIPLALHFVGWIPYYVITLLYFLCVVLIFVPLGQYTGRCMRAFSPMHAYSLNLLGALLGTLLFIFVSFLWMPPTLWFAITSLMVLPLVWSSASLLRVANVLGALILILIQGWPVGTVVWSPYNKLAVAPAFLTGSDGKQFQWGYLLSVGEYYYQNLADFSVSFFQAHPDAGPALRYTEYEVPYTFSQPEKVLILGAGTGNDVAAALRHGAQHVDAVDIDPGIIEFGRRLHPEQPYASSAVTAHVNDARAFLREPGPNYDLVLFGLLDSQQVLSAFGSVRLDNFVYTVEGMGSAFDRVANNGYLVVTFEIFQPWMADRIAGIMESATGQTPTVLDAPHGTVFIVRKGEPISQQDIIDARAKLGGQAKPLLIDTHNESLTTDNWPYLYLRHKTLPLAYWTMLPLLVVASWGLSRRILGRGWAIQWRFFLLGAAFMLMEVRIIAQSALIFGSTWLVSAAAITAVLVMAILANLLVTRLPRTRLWPWAILLLVTLGASSMIPSSVFLKLGQLPGGAAAAFVLALPIFFAGMVFSISLRQIRNVDTAMASNLLGSILGGFIEYLSLLLGIGSLAWLAGLLYLLALFAPAEVGRESSLLPDALPDSS